MAEIKEKDFWGKEHKILWESFDRLQDEVKQYEFPARLLKDFEDECMTLHNFFMGKSFPDFFPPEKMKQLESEVRALGYSTDKGVRNWFKNRKKEKECSFYKNRTLPLSKRGNKEEGEKACVKKFYENKGQCLKDSQVKTTSKDSPVDVIVVEEGGKEVKFQVTIFLRKIEGQLLKGDSPLFEVNPEEIRKEVIEVIKDKEPKSVPDIKLLLYSWLLRDDKELLERAVTELTVNSSFREIYIVTPEHNIPVKTSIGQDETCRP